MTKAQQTTATAPGLLSRCLRSLGQFLVAVTGWLWAQGSGLLLFTLRNLRPRRVRAFARIGKAAYRRYLRQDGDAMAGYIAFAGFLAVFPFAIFATALAGWFVSAEESDAIINALFGLAPSHIAQTLEPVVHSVIGGSGDRLITISGVGAIWVASSAIEAIRVGFDRAYGNPVPRPFLVRRSIALLFVLLATVTFGVLGLLIIAAPLGLVMAEHWVGFDAPFGVGVVRYALGLTMLSLFLFQLHLLLPTTRPPRRRLFPGIATSMVLWAIGAFAFSEYLAAAPSYSITYGTLAGVIVTLLFFYLTGAAILFGAQVNAALMCYRRPRRADHEP